MSKTDRTIKKIVATSIAVIMLLAVSACGPGGEGDTGGGHAAWDAIKKVARQLKIERESGKTGDMTGGSGQGAKASEEELEALADKISLRQDFHDEFIHGEKGAKYQKYIVLHDTEGSGNADSVISGWLSDGNKIASHFIVNTDGTVVQCVPIDKIAHHAGFGDTGHNEKFGVMDESRDDKAGTQPIGEGHADYGMNSYSVGIEMVHIGGGEAYTEEQLEAVDMLIEYIDGYFGKKSDIIDHKMWRNGNSDTSPEFAEYLENYRDHRTHD